MNGSYYTAERLLAMLHEAGRLRGQTEELIRLRAFDPALSAALDALVNVEDDLTELVATSGNDHEGGAV